MGMAARADQIQKVRLLAHTPFPELISTINGFTLGRGQLILRLMLTSFG